MRLIDVDDIPSEILDGIVKNEKLDLPNTHITVRSILETQDTIEAIPKADYEARLKADLEAILVELQLEIKEQLHDNSKEYGQTMYNNGLFKSYVLIQQKINALKGGNVYAE